MSLNPFHSHCSRKCLRIKWINIDTENCKDKRTDCEFGEILWLLFHKCLCLKIKICFSSFNWNHPSFIEYIYRGHQLRGVPVWVNMNLSKRKQKIILLLCLPIIIKLAMKVRHSTVASGTTKILSFKNNKEEPRVGGALL